VKVGPSYASLADAGRYLGCSTRTVRRLIHGGLPAFRLGPRGRLRIRFADIDCFMASHRPPDLDAIVDEICEEFLLTSETCEGKP